MNYETLSFDVAGGIGRMTLNRPDRLNAMTPRMIEEIIDVVDRSAKDDAVRVLVITGTGRGFCAGADLTGIGPRPVDASGHIDIGPSMEKLFNPMIRKIRALEKPVVAAVNGVAAGGGANLALAADICVATRSAVFKQAFVAISLIPDLGGTWFLTHLLGDARARGLAMLGDSITAEQAAQWGMIWQVVDDAAFAGEIEKLARRLADGPAALGSIKKAINAAPHNTLSQQLDLERDLQSELGRSHDFIEGVSAFLQKRKANFKGR
jgi:2-(1,2-epoxy-1,2-dihydrophenyl)acetyl-CoA isomerase